MPDAHAKYQPMGLLPEEARRRMAEIGPVWGRDIIGHRDIVLEVYTPLAARGPKEGVSVTRDLAYGAHPRHRLDVFRPAPGAAFSRDPHPGAAFSRDPHPGAAFSRDPQGAKAPVLMFVHGGAFIRGDKSVNAELFDNILYYFARHGCLGINVEYRLATDAPFPGGAQDLARAVDWVRAHAAEHGGDPGRIFIMGQSAGATHVATYACNPNVGLEPAPGVAGIILTSGRLRADVRPENPNANGVRAYFGDDVSKYDERSPVTYAGRCPVPVMISIVEFENPLLDVYGAEFFWRVAAARGRAPRFVRLRNHNHASVMAQFNTGEETLGPEILDFMATLR